MDLTGKSVIVTGASKGIGRELALEFGRQGAGVVCAARNMDQVSETASDIRRGGGDAVAVEVDVTCPGQVESMAAAALEQFGKIDVLFNNAGSFTAIGGLWQVDPEDWWRDVTVNLRGPMLCAKAVLPHMMERNEGIIINMDGGGSSVPFAGGSGYACSKAALMRLTDSLDAELRRVGSAVMVFGMGPGLVRTGMTELQATTPLGLEWIGGVKDAFDAGRDRPATDCARATVELIRTACPEISGCTFGVDTDFSDVARRTAEIRESDEFVLRVKR